MTPTRDMEQIRNHSAPIVYGSGWPIDNGSSVHRVLMGALHRGFYAWSTHEITFMEVRDSEEVAFEAKMTKPMGTAGTDTLYIKGVIQTHTIIVNSPQDREPVFYSYMHVFWETGG